MSLSFELLESIKTSDSNDVFLLLEGCDFKAEDEEAEDLEDPLEAAEENVNSLKGDSLWEFEEDDLLNDHDGGNGDADGDADGDGDGDDLPSVIGGNRGGKKPRCCGEFKSRNGRLWSTARTTNCGPLTKSSKAYRSIQPTNKGPAKRASNILEAWLLLVDEPILEIIARHTNEEIHKQRGKSAHQERITDLVELRAWIGLNYLCGIFRNSPHNGPIAELWTVELGNAIFRSTMSLQRFQFLAKCLKFSDAVTCPGAPFASVQNFWGKFMVNCRSYYAPSGHCTVDDHIIATTDPCCPMQCYLPRNPAEHGLSIVTLCDARTLYMCNALLLSSETASEDELLHLVGDIKGTWRTVCIKERYTTHAFAAKLQQCQLNLVGALPATSGDIPAEMLDTRTPQDLYDGAITLTGCAASSRTEFLLASGIPDNISTKKLHRRTHNSCQRFQQLVDVYSTHYATPPQQHRWQLQLFQTLLNYAAHNAWVILRLSEKGDVAQCQRDMQRQLGLYLTQQQLKRNLARDDKLPLTQKLHISEMLGEPTDRLLADAIRNATSNLCEGTIPLEKLSVPEGVKLLPRYMPKRMRCRNCPSKNSCKTRSRCQQCLRALCNRHLIIRCASCTGVQNVQKAGNGNGNDEADEFFK